MKWGFAVGLLAIAGCTQAFNFSDDGGLDGGDGGLDAGTDAGCLATGECECEAATDCSGVRSRCNPDHRCVECVGDADCGLNGFCEPLTHRCNLICASSLDCAGTARTTCGDDLPKHCEACDDSPSCLQPGQPFCAESIGYCVGCIRDSQCDGGLLPYCDLRFGGCVQCLNSTQCAPTELCRAASGTCQPRP